VLQADNEQLKASLAAATAQVSKMQAQLACLSELQETLQASLQGKQSAEASLMTQLTQVCNAKHRAGRFNLCTHTTACISTMAGAVRGGCRGLSWICMARTTKQPFVSRCYGYAC
jgi:hypothetical protein